MFNLQREVTAVLHRRVDDLNEKLALSVDVDEDIYSTSDVVWRVYVRLGPCGRSSLREFRQHIQQI